MSQKLSIRQQCGAALHGASTMLCKQAKGAEMHKPTIHRHTHSTQSRPHTGATSMTSGDHSDLFDG